MSAGGTGFVLPKRRNEYSVTLTGRDQMDVFENKLRKESFKMFYHKFSKPFWYFILKICGDESMADDLFQESFFRFFRTAPAAMDEHQQKAYLYKTAVRLLIDQKKKIKVEARFRNESGGGIMEEDKKMLSLDMEKIFALLRPRERIMLWLAYVDGYSHVEIARMTGNREKSIKVQLFRIRQKFASILKSHGYAGGGSI